MSSNIRIIVSRLPIEEEDQVKILDIAVQGAKLNFDHHGKVTPVAILFARRDFNTGETYESGPHVIMLEPKEFVIESDKDDFAWIVKNIATKTNASDLAFVSEVWLTMLDQTTGDKTKTEAIVITTESIYGESEMWIAEINRSSSGEGKLRDFIKQEEFSLSTGRFVGLLPTKKFVS